MNESLIDILNEMDILWQNFVNCRAHFPYVPNEMIGQVAATTAPYYIKQGFHITFNFGEPLTEDIIKKINAIGHWINQNFIVRLCALLESNHILSNEIPIDFDLDGSDDVDLVRRLRNYFAHSSGKYNSSKSEHRKTLEKMGTHLNVDIKNRIDFPLSIGTVIEPLFKGCKKYVESKMKTA